MAKLNLGYFNFVFKKGSCCMAFSSSTKISKKYPTLLLTQGTKENLKMRTDVKKKGITIEVKSKEEGCHGSNFS